MLINDYYERLRRAKETQHKILKFLRDQCFSCPTILAQVAGLSHRAIYKKLNSLLDEGFIVSHKYEAIPFQIWGITNKGLIYSWDDNEEMEERAPFHPSRTKPMMLNHELGLQQARVNFENVGGIDWMPGHLLPKGIKHRPDSVINYRDAKIFCEYEATIKSRVRYSRLWSYYLQKISKHEVDFIHYICPTIEFANRLVRVFGLLKSIPVAGEQITLTHKHRSKFKVFSLDKWPPQ